MTARAAEHPGSPHAGEPRRRATGPRVPALDSSADPLALVARWRAQAAAYEQDGQPGAALLRRVAEELERAQREHALAELTMAQAAAESGYSASQLRKRFPGRRTVRRLDLPRKGGGQGEGPDLARAILRGERA
ncbi:MAG TPA: hypothetical protein VEK77_13080 [Gemmatimonadales bacterium]|nr:hypothetical protein [Gemmatimonadales bacterium]